MKYQYVIYIVTWEQTMKETRKEDKINMVSDKDPSITEIGFGITRDLIKVIKPITKSSFHFAKVGSHFGFKVANTVIQDAPKTIIDNTGIDSSGFLQSSFESLGSVVDFAKEITETSINFYEQATLFSIDSIDGILDAAGAEHGHTSRLFVNSAGWGTLSAETAAALVGVMAIVSTFAGEFTALGVSGSYNAGKAYYLLQQVDRANDLALSSIPTISIDELIKVNFMYAIAAYGHVSLKSLGFLSWKDYELDDLAAACAVVGVEKENILYQNWGSDVYNPAHLLIVDDKAKSVIITIRGTMSVHDVITDLSCETVPFDLYFHDSNEVIHGFAHGGMLETAKRFAGQLHEQVIDALRSRPTHKLVITGHSLGAGVATLLTMLWSQLPEFLNANMHAFAYAPPCTLSENIASHEKVQDLITSVILGDDLIPRLSLGSATDLRNAIFRLSREEEQDGMHIVRTILEEAANGDFHWDSQTTAMHRAWMKQIRIEEMNSEKPYPAGRIIWIDPSVGKSWNAKELSPTRFSEISISSSMFSIHLPHRYFEALNGFE